MSEGFLGQAVATASGLGLPEMPLALLPGHPGVQSEAELRQNVQEVTLARVLDGLTRTPSATNQSDDFAPEEIVYRGTFEDVNEHFLQKGWGDGLPVVPPTKEKVADFLRFTDLPPDHLIGVVPADNRALTVRTVAINGVMAGCRPEYMPILVAIGEAMCDPDYGVEHSGNTPGAETLVILNGPIIKELGFNYEQGVLRDGFQANTSIGRFWRLLLRNVAGFLPRGNDKGAFGNTWRVVMPENHDALARIGWASIAKDMGLAQDANAVTIARYTGGDVIVGVMGDTPEVMMPSITDTVVKMHRWQLCFTIGLAEGMLRPLLVLSPILAETMAKAGWTKQHVQEYLFKHARIPAHEFQQYIGRNRTIDIRDEARLGRIPKLFYESDDPNRLLPIAWEPDDFMIAVSGDPLRTNAYAFGHNGTLGFPVIRAIKLPKDWKRLLKKKA